MSPIRTTRPTGRHRKPRQARATQLLRGGVLSGVLGTIAVAAPAGTAQADEKPTEATGELPTVTTLSTVHVAGAAQAAEAAERYISAADLDQAQTLAWVRAEKAAAKQKADEEEARAAEERAARERAAEEARAAEERAAEEAAAEERSEQAASRSAERTPLAATSGEASTAPSASAPAPAPSGSGSGIVGFARSQVGSAYQLGATGPGAWDCSGLTGAAYASAGISLPRTSQEQSAMGTAIAVSDAQPGDLLYWGGRGSAYHVAIYVGNGKFVGAQNPSTGVVEQDLSYSPPTGAVRIG
ncbi:C40 family peptidase [Streptomyces lonarensis]|uniref:C40 family peptidase n=1 Tax=Streptomyces lonarensis TaxID=700599 RepID=A0A7X6D2R8_9ACTN|nr:C40 family peptidase [Streptomyces lonarensis]NJQ07015.1 C40 family peptidase [Streptomyces lonarensis]